MIDETVGLLTAPVRATTEVRAPGRPASSARVSALPRTGNADFLVNARALGANRPPTHIRAFSMNEGSTMAGFLGLDELFEGRHFDREVIVRQIVVVLTYPDPGTTDEP
jgi:hypothetical protein